MKKERLSRDIDPLISGIADRIGANRVVLALSAARLADAMGNSILFVIIPLYVARLPSPAFDLPEPLLVGVLISLYGFVSSLAQPVVGALADRVSRRKPIILAGLGIMAAGTIAFVFATRFLHLLLIRGAQGVGVAMTIPASLALMAAATETRTRGGAMGIYTSMRMAGFTLGPLLGGWLHDDFGFAAAFYVGAALVALGMLLVQLWVDERPVEVSRTRGAPFRLFERGLITRGIVGLGIATFVMAAAFTEMVSLEQQFNTRLSQGALGFGVAFSALMVSRLIFQIPLGSLSDRIGRKPLVLTGLMLMAPATMLLGFAGSTLQLTGVRVLQGVASAAIAAPAFAMAAELSTAGVQGRQMAMVTMGFGLGIAVGPLMAGALAIVFFELPFLVGGALCLVGALVVWWLVPETVHRRSRTSDTEEVRAA